MPQVDHDTLVTSCAGGNDRKISCETLADDDPAENDVIPDQPPGSFWLSQDAEYDWFDRNAFYERKESTKGNSNSTNLNPNSTSTSQRFGVNFKSKASILGLPKTQKATYVESKRRACKPANASLFPKRSESVGKAVAPVAEPGSPKVSCMGRVRSKRSRRRSNSIKRHEKPMDKSGNGSEKKQKASLFSKIVNLFRSKKGRKKMSRSGSRRVVEVVMEESVDVEPQRKSVSVRVREIPMSTEPLSDPPGLGGMKCFASGRRSGSWTSEDFNRVGA